jgi:bud site selection protein 20
MKALETEPYTQAEANRAAGIGSYIKPKSFTIKTQPDKETFNKIFENEPDKNAII